MNKHCHKLSSTLEAAPADALFAVPDAVPAVIDEKSAPTEKVTERQMLDLLRQRYTRVSMNAHRYAFAEHVPIRPGWPNRIVDFIAADCYGNLSGHAFHGHEVKCSRSDWLTELRDPDKAEAFKPYMDFWWLVTASPGICRPDELPAGWGLMVKAGDQLRATVRAPKLTPEPMPRHLLFALLRATAKTARNDLTQDDFASSRLSALEVLS